MSNKLINWIIEEKKARGWTYRQIADFAGDVKHSQIVNVVNEKRAVTFSFCKSIAIAFDVPELTILQLAGLIEVTDATVLKLARVERKQEHPELEPAL